ncbi:MAG: cell division protein FtsQ/DivIB [Sarcina sp.]
MDKQIVKKNSKKVELYFKEKKRKKRRRKIAFVSLILIIGTVIFLFKSPVFNIKKVIVSGNKMLKEIGIVNKKEIEGKNVFLLDTNIIKDKVNENPYIESVSVKRSDLNTISINIKERKMFYKVIHENKVYILNNQLYIMDILDDDKNLELVDLHGIVPDTLEIGSRIINSDEIAKIAENIGNDLIEKQNKSIFSKLDLTDKGAISICVQDIKIILGRPIDLDSKYQKAIDIINSKNIDFNKGYIDVSVLEHPVIKVDEQSESLQGTNLDHKETNENISEDKPQQISENVKENIEENISNAIGAEP